MEEWRPLVGYEEFYQVSSTGLIKRLNIVYFRKTDGLKCTLKEKILTYSVSNHGYYRVIISKFDGGGSKQVFPHVLVAKTFIPNPDNLPQVNHKDGDKLNNSIDNLEWCDTKYNVLHSYRDEHMIHSNAKAVIQKDMEGNVINRFMTMRQAQEITGIDRKFIRWAIRNDKPYHNFLWEDWDRKVV